MAKKQFTIGDGVATQFDLDCEFSTQHALLRVFDTSHGGQEVPIYGIQLQTPNATSIRLSLKPAPPAGAIKVRVSDGTEKP